MKERKLLRITRQGGTFLATIANFKTRELYDIYCQFSFKDPWLKPGYDPHFGNTKIPLWGWLFFYFGKATRGMLLKRKPENCNPSSKILLHNHCTYQIQYAGNRKQADIMHYLTRYKLPVKIHTKKKEDTLIFETDKTNFPVKRDKKDRYDYSEWLKTEESKYFV